MTDSRTVYDRFQDIIGFGWGERTVRLEIQNPEDQPSVVEESPMSCSSIAAVFQDSGILASPSQRGRVYQQWRVYT